MIHRNKFDTHGVFKICLFVGLVILAAAVSPSQAKAQTYCNGQTYYQNGQRVFPNGSPIKNLSLIPLFPNGAPARDLYRKVLYPNGDLVRDVYRRTLYPGGGGKQQVLKDQLGRMFWPGGQTALIPYSGCYLPNGSLITCQMAVWIGIDFDGILIRLNLDFEVGNLEDSEVEFWVGKDRAKYVWNVQTGEASEVRLYCKP